MFVFTVPAQPVDATHALNLSAGVSNDKVLRGRSFTAHSEPWLTKMTAARL